MAMSEREKKLALATAVVMVVGLSYIGLKVMSSGDSVEVSAATAGRFQTLFDQMEDVENQKDKNQTLRKSIGNLQGKFISEKDISELYAEIEQLAGRSGVQVKNISNVTNRRAKPMPRLEANLSMECQFQQLIQFLDNLKTSKLMLQPLDVRAQLKDPNQPNLQIQLTLVTYLMDGRASSSSPTSLQQENGA
ncbi:MAG: type 4a pilus biogenesis protein PilO [bacterium]|nr:type 4a pilus biogenesis protein PilO [bacterium]